MKLKKVDAGCDSYAASVSCKSVNKSCVDFLNLNCSNNINLGKL